MPQLRYDAFIHSLKLLQYQFPEFADVLQHLIDEMAKGKQQSIRQKLTNLREEDW